MSLGPAKEKRKARNFSEEDRLWRLHMESEERTDKNWEYRWSWLLNEYKGLESKLRDISRNSIFVKDVNDEAPEEDRRSIKKIPQTTNHEYGWLAAKPEFNLETFGPDVHKGQALPEIYQIQKG